MNLEEKKAYVEQNIQKIPKNELALYENNFACVLTRNSVCIEGYSITLEDVVSITKGLNLKGDIILNRSVYNHYKAYQMIKDKTSLNEPLTEDFVKDVHEVLMEGIINGGLYRNVDISIKGSHHTPCSYIKVYDRMSKFFFDINNFTGSPLEKAAYTQLQIAKIHPFLDGNGRLARLMMNYQLLNNGYLPISIPRKRRSEYFDALESFKVEKSNKLFMDFMIDLLEKEYDRLIDVINSQK